MKKIAGKVFLVVIGLILFFGCMRIYNENERTQVNSQTMRSRATRQVPSHCASTDSPFKSNIYCPGYMVYDEPGGFLYEVTAKDFPAIEGYISMTYQELAPYCLRQLHWHANNEIGYVVSGSARVGVVGTHGNQSFFNVSAGDAWFFPQGFLQYFQAGPDGLKLLLWFTKDSVSTVTIPSLLNEIPRNQLQNSYFVNDTTFFNEWNLSNNGTACPNIDPTWTIPPSNCSSESESPFKLSLNCSAKATRDPFGNQILEAVAASFPILADNGLSFSYAVIKPGCQRVLHWHTIPGELALVLQGSASVGLFSFDNAAGEPTPYLFDVGAGDIWFFPTGYLQYITNNAPPGGEDVIAVLGFSYDSIVALTQAQGLLPLPEDIIRFSLLMNDDAVLQKWRLSDAPFTCINKP